MVKADIYVGVGLSCSRPVEWYQFCINGETTTTYLVCSPPVPMNEARMNIGSSFFKELFERHGVDDINIVNGRKMDGGKMDKIKDIGSGALALIEFSIRGALVE